MGADSVVVPSSLVICTSAECRVTGDSLGVSPENRSSSAPVVAPPRSGRSDRSRVLVKAPFPWGLEFAATSAPPPLPPPLSSHAPLEVNVVPSLKAAIPFRSCVAMVWFALVSFQICCCFASRQPNLTFSLSTFFIRSGFALCPCPPSAAT